MTDTSGISEVVTSAAAPPPVSAEAIVSRARALIPAVREQAVEAERIGHHVADLDREFREAGFYRMLQPRRFGGYEFDLGTFWRVMIEIAEGDPGTGWGLALGAQHALVVAAHFPEAGQAEVFGQSGDFSSPHRPGNGQALETDEGYIVSGTWDYCSGVAHATHFMCNVTVSRSDGEAPRNLVIIVPRDQITVIDDWGGGATLGMNSSGSNTVTMDEVYVPVHRTTPANWHSEHGSTVGTELHKNPMYLGRIAALYHAVLVTPLIGAARASLEEYEGTITTKKTARPPIVFRNTLPEYQQVYGQAAALNDSAEALVMRAAGLYHEYCDRWAATGQPFTREQDVRLYAMLQEAGQMAVRSVQLIFSAAGSTATKRGQNLQRYYRDTSMYIGHIGAQQTKTAIDLAQLHFGLLK